MPSGRFEDPTHVRHVNLVLFQDRGARFLWTWWQSRGTEWYVRGNRVLGSAEPPARSPELPASSHGRGRSRRLRRSRGLWRPRSLTLATVRTPVPASGTLTSRRPRARHHTIARAPRNACTRPGPRQPERCPLPLLGLPLNARPGPTLAHDRSATPLPRLLSQPSLARVRLHGRNLPHTRPRRFPARTVRATTRRMRAGKWRGQRGPGAGEGPWYHAAQPLRCR